MTALRAPFSLGSLTSKTGGCAPLPTHRSFSFIQLKYKCINCPGFELGRPRDGLPEKMLPPRFDLKTSEIIENLWEFSNHFNFRKNHLTFAKLIFSRNLGKNKYFRKNFQKSLVITIKMQIFSQNVPFVLYVRVLTTFAFAFLSLGCC